MSLLAPLPLLLACSACADAVLVRATWVPSAFPDVALVLLVDALVFAAYARVRRAQGVPRGAPVLGFGVVLALATAFVAGPRLASGVLGAFAAVHFVRTSAWLARAGDRGLHRVAQLRALVVGVLVIAAAVRAAPSFRSTDSLVDLASLHAATLTPVSWVERELQRRPDALARVEARLDETADAWAAVRMLRVHEVLGGPPEVRAATCERAEVREYAATSERTLALCPPAPERSARPAQ